MIKKIAKLLYQSKANLLWNSGVCYKFKESGKHMRNKSGDQQSELCYRRRFKFDW